MNRRKFISLAVNTSSAIAMGAVAVPVVVNALNPILVSDAEGQDWRLVGRADQFSSGKIEAAVVHFSNNPELEAIASRSVYVWRQDKPESPFIVYSRSCTDLGCPITWDPGSEWFYCPCHGGIFSKEGERKAGPPKKPLWKYATRVREGLLEIDVRSVPPMV